MRLDVFDVLGQRVQIIEQGLRALGEHTVTFDATSLASGIYFYTLTAGEFTRTRKMVLMR